MKLIVSLFSCEQGHGYSALERMNKIYLSKQVTSEYCFLWPRYEALNMQNFSMLLYGPLNICKKTIKY